MSRPRFLADNDLDDHIIDGVLRRVPGAEFVRCREVDLARRPDPEVLHYAGSRGLIVVSHDVSTMLSSAYDRLRTGRPMSGLLAAMQSAPIGPIIDSLVLIWLSTEADEWQGGVSSCRCDSLRPYGPVVPMNQLATTTVQALVRPIIVPFGTGILTRCGPIGGARDAWGRPASA